MLLNSQRFSTSTWRRTALAIFAGWHLTAGPAFAGAEDVIGEWRTPASVYVQIKPCGDSICGRIVRLPDPSVYDQYNPEPRLRTRPVLGIMIFTSTRRAGTSGWKGHMYVPESGYTYVSRLISVDHAHMRVSICGPMGFFCSSETWTRTR